MWYYLCVNFVLCRHTLCVCACARACVMLSLNYHFANLFSYSQKIAYRGMKIEGGASTWRMFLVKSAPPKAPPRRSTHEQNLKIMGDSHQCNMDETLWRVLRIRMLLIERSVVMCQNAHMQKQITWRFDELRPHMMNKCWVWRRNLMCHGSNHFGQRAQSKSTKVAFVFGWRSVRCGVKVTKNKVRKGKVSLPCWLALSGQARDHRKRLFNLSLQGQATQYGLKRTLSNDIFRT